jgi:hypothetical protein
MARPKSPQKLIQISVKVAPDRNARRGRFQAEHRSLSNVIRLALAGCGTHLIATDAERSGYSCKWRRTKSRLIMSHTIAECLEHARECGWYAAHTGNEEDRKFLLRKAKDWKRMAVKIRASARIAAQYREAFYMLQKGLRSGTIF